VLGVFAVFDCGGAGLLTFAAVVSPRPPTQLGMSIMILLLKISYIKYLFLPKLDTARLFAGFGAFRGWFAYILSYPHKPSIKSLFLRVVQLLKIVLHICLHWPWIITSF